MIFDITNEMFSIFNYMTYIDISYFTVIAIYVLRLSSIAAKRCKKEHVLFSQLGKPNFTRNLTARFVAESGLQSQGVFWCAVPGFCRGGKRRFEIRLRVLRCLDLTPWGTRAFIHQLGLYNIYYII